jgi:hypothetical protein
MPALRFFRNLFGHIITGDETNALNDNYQIYGEVRVEKIADSGNYFKTAGFLMDPSIPVQAFFVINSAFRGWFTAPFFNPWTITNIGRVFYNKLLGKLYGGEFYGEIPEVTGELTLIEEYVVLKGGIKLSQGFTAAFNDLTTNKRFLTNHPSTKVISAAQPELLHYIVFQSDVTQVKLKVKIHYTDLTDTTITPKTISSIAQWDLLRIPVGVTSLALAAVTPSKTILYYEVWLEDQDDVVMSESKFYELDQYMYETERFWMYENSYGMPEVFRTVGRASFRTAISTTASKRMITYDYNPKVPSFHVNRTNNRTETEVSTGYLRDKATASYMLDFLTQKGVLYLLEKNDFFPYQMQSPSMHEERTDDEFNYYVRFKVLGAFENQ